jgi:hypothetical protein
MWLMTKQKEFDERVSREHALKVREAQVKLEEQALVEACSQPLRKYLMLNVIPGNILRHSTQLHFISAID